MATVYVSVGRAGVMSSGGSVPVFSGRAESETITSSSSAASGALSPTAPGSVAKIFCETAVYASASGTASATNGVYVEAGRAEYIALEPGSTISVIDA